MGLYKKLRVPFRMLFLSQARPLGGLHRASPLPFRASYFTSGLHPPDATAQRLTLTCISDGVTDFIRSLIPSSRLVAHIAASLPLGQKRFHQRAPTTTIRISQVLTTCGEVVEMVLDPEIPGAESSDARVSGFGACRQLLGAQRGHRIDAGGARSGNPGC